MLQLHTWKKGKENDFVGKENPNHIKRKIDVPLELVMDERRGNKSSELEGEEEEDLLLPRSTKKLRSRCLCQISAACTREHEA
jgi:phosphoenolpyruvate synthase/pyruvate phosphate dikinase